MITSKPCLNHVHFPLQASLQDHQEDIEHAKGGERGHSHWAGRIRMHSADKPNAANRERESSATATVTPPAGSRQPQNNIRSHAPSLCHM
ncbi:hypothetical protein AcW1_008110 [Taiwanofungus camphoratus]|nr:hypothetical protein AcW1_008110 [Antrodia cinnamomea]KAI0955851.1 hypothetical protein AcV7_006403 [Antrodia cinnamomea]